MKKNRTKHPSRNTEFPSGRSVSTRKLTLPEVLVKVGRSLHDLVTSSGLEIFQALLAQDQMILCGSRHQPQTDRQAYRHGTTEGPLVFGGRKIRLTRPRVRSIKGHEVELPTWKEFSEEDPLNARAVEQMLVGVSTRGYARSLEPLDEDHESIAVSRSSVSRRFVAKTKDQVTAFLSRPLGELDLPVIMLDGVCLADHVLIVALGIDTEGRKHVLGLVEGSTESEEVCRSLLRNLIDRGLKVERARLFVIDGSKGVRKAVRSVFGLWALIQRCQVHKLRNVLDHLPQGKRSWMRAAIRRAWAEETAEKARRKLMALASQLDETHPGAAGSLREGLEETVTVLDLGLGSWLLKTLCSTNPIENLQGGLRRVTRNVKRWRGGAMAQRWGATALMESEKGFRRIKGYRDLPQLLKALDALIAGARVDKTRRVA
jgi:putative transposase